jgi:histidinol-phosphatase (PHP family)
MPHTHHSHSGQFCPGHAVDDLESIIQHALSLKMTVFALTEHMPRHDVDRYPSEIASNSTLPLLQENETAYVKEALRLREKYSGQLEMPIGFEGEWIRPESQGLVEQSIKLYDFDFFIGSVHHVHTVPVDYDDETYREARRIAGGTDERLFEDYFDSQFEMLKALRPPVVGHFDLIRLKSDDFNVSLKSMPGVWDRAMRNLDFIAGYGGLVEINSAAVRKGMDEPYPNREICKAALQRGIRFCLSDDSHGIAQVAHSYARVLAFLEKAGISSVTYLRHCEQGSQSVDQRFPTLGLVSVDLSRLKEEAFWSVAKTP